jgi:hypothetical protein
MHSLSLSPSLSARLEPAEKKLITLVNFKYKKKRFELEENYKKKLIVNIVGTERDVMAFTQFHFFFFYDKQFIVKLELCEHKALLIIYKQAR